MPSTETGPKKPRRRWFPRLEIEILQNRIKRLEAEYSALFQQFHDHKNPPPLFHVDRDGNETNEVYDRCGHCGTYYADMPRQYDRHDREEELKAMDEAAHQDDERFERENRESLEAEAAEEETEEESNG